LIWLFGKLLFGPSFAVGVGHIFTANASGIPPWLYRFCLSVALSVVAVGHNGDTVSFVRGIDTASWNNKRLDFVTFVFQ
jgi:hypothetical protein